MSYHGLKQPFILATGVAAFIHSTWSLATYFSGHPPIWPGEVTLGYAASLAYWLIPAMLIAFAIDLGMVSTSTQIREGNRSYSKLTTFAVLALATYLLQLTYILAHMPSIPLAEGVRTSWLPIASLVRDMSLFVIPAFLPAATWLYTLDHHENEKTLMAVSPTYLNPTKGANLPVLSEFEGIVGNPDDGFSAKCPDCSWKAEYPSHYQAKQGLAAHSRSHLKEKSLPTNGNHHLEEV